MDRTPLPSPRRQALIFALGILLFGDFLMQADPAVAELLYIAAGFISLIPILPFLAGLLSSSLCAAISTAVYLVLLPETLLVVHCETFVPCVGHLSGATHHLLDGHPFWAWLLRLGAGAAFAVFAAGLAFCLRLAAKTIFF